MKYRGHTSPCAIAFCLVLCTVANDTQADWGLRVGGVHAATELDDGPGYGLSTFIRPSLSPRHRVEFNAGYGRLQGADYATDLASGEGRLLYVLGRGRYWSAHLYGGAGLLRFNLATSPPETTPDAAAIVFMLAASSFGWFPSRKLTPTAATASRSTHSVHFPPWHAARLSHV